MIIELRDSLEFLFPDSVVGKNPCNSMTLDVARAGTAAVHVLLNELKEGSAIRVSLRDARGAVVRAAQWFRLVDVPVEGNTGPVGFAEKEGEHNELVIRRAPFRVCDVMEPISGSARAAGPIMALRVHLPIPANARPEERTYSVRIKRGREEERLSLTVKVHKPAIPPVGRDSWPYTNWFNYELMATRHGFTPWAEGHWRMMRKYADLMARGRQNMFRVTWSEIFDMKADLPVLNHERLQRIVNTFTKAGLHYIEGGHVAGRRGGEWKASTFDVTLSRGLRATSIEGNAFLSRALHQLREEIERNGWSSRWIQHVADEPADENATDYRILAGMVRKYLPGIPLVDATMTTELVGSVNTWCPQCQEYQHNREKFEAQRALGDKVWFYVCCFPGGPWLNRFLDEELLRPLLLGWGAALYDLDGFLHWGLNQYASDEHPFEKTLVRADEDNWLPPGDGHVIYPGPKEPWSGLRFEAQREGVEDLELLRQLAERDPKRTGAIVRRVIRGFNQYTKDARVLRRARRDLLQAL